MKPEWTTPVLAFLFSLISFQIGRMSSCDGKLKDPRLTPGRGLYCCGIHSVCPRCPFAVRSRLRRRPGRCGFTGGAVLVKSVNVIE